MGWASQKLPENAYQKLVLLMLASHMNAATGLCNPSIKTLALECCCSESTVKLALVALARQGLISHQTGRHGRKSNIYKLSTDGGFVGRAAARGVAVRRPVDSRNTATKQEVETVTIKQNLVEKKGPVPLSSVAQQELAKLQALRPGRKTT